MTLGQFVREKRMAAKLSLRELAERVKVTAPFLSDVELGRRFPKEDTLSAIASALETTVEEMKKYDARQQVADVRRLVESDPAYGFAFRTLLDEVERKKLSPEELVRRVTKKPEKR